MTLSEIYRARASKLAEQAKSAIALTYQERLALAYARLAAEAAPAPTAVTTMSSASPTSLSNTKLGRALRLQCQNL
jgi:hypothetical protein